MSASADGRKLEPFVTVEMRLHSELKEAERQAWLSLARYKFQMFGYWSGVWVHLNRISGLKLPNPWRALVHIARDNCP